MDRDRVVAPTKSIDVRLDRRAFNDAAVAFLNAFGPDFHDLIGRWGPTAREALLVWLPFRWYRGYGTYRVLPSDRPMGSVCRHVELNYRYPSASLRALMPS